MTESQHARMLFLRGQLRVWQGRGAVAILGRLRAYGIGKGLLPPYALVAWLRESGSAGYRNRRMRDFLSGIPTLLVGPCFPT